MELYLIEKVIEMDDNKWVMVLSLILVIDCELTALIVLGALWYTPLLHGFLFAVGTSCLNLFGFWMQFRILEFTKSMRK